MLIKSLALGLYLKNKIQNSLFILHLQNSVAIMPALNRNEKVVCDNCGKQYVRAHAARHKKSCQGGTLSCPKCPNYSTKSQAELSYHIAKKHGPSTPKLSTTCTLCWEEFPSYYALQRHKRT